MSFLSRYPTLAALIATDPDRAHALLGPIERALMAEGDERIRQVWRWFDSGVCGAGSFEDILSHVPEIPASLLPDRPEFPLLTLVPGHIGIVQVAGAAGLWYSGTDRTFVPFDSRDVLPRGWTWIRAHDGSPNLDLAPSLCRSRCAGSRFVGTALVGSAIHLIHGLRANRMDLPGSVRRGTPDYCACVRLSDAEEPLLSPGRSVEDPDPESGTVEFVLK